MFNLHGSAEKFKSFLRFLLGYVGLLVNTNRKLNSIYLSSIDFLVGGGGWGVSLSRRFLFVFNSPNSNFILGLDS